MHTQGDRASMAREIHCNNGNVGDDILVKLHNEFRGGVDASIQVAQCVIVINHQCADWSGCCAKHYRAQMKLHPGPLALCTRLHPS